MFKKFMDLKSLFYYFKDKNITPEEQKRKQFIFYIISAFSIFLTGIFSVFLIYRAIKLGFEHRGCSVGLFLIILTLFIGLHYIAKKGLLRLSSYLLVGIYFFSASLTLFYWGADVPLGLLAYALVITIAGILINASFSLKILFLASIFLLSFTFLQTGSDFIVQNYWKKEALRITDTLEHIIILGVITVLAWLSNKEIEKSLKKVKLVQKVLKQERDLLEIKVTKRTKELHKAQLEKIKHIYHFVEFGRISSGLFHDLMNYLTAFSLGARGRSLKNGNGNQKILINQLNEITSLTNYLEEFIVSVQKQLKNEGLIKKFSINKEVLRVLKILDYRVKKENIQIIFKAKERLMIVGDVIKFGHVLTNLLTNAMDAYLNYSRQDPKNNKKILIILKRHFNKIILQIRDWGIGIKLTDQIKIFEPFYSTKSCKDKIGIGLSTTKEIIQKDFNGKIELISKEGRGSIFSIVILPKN